MADFFIDVGIESDESTLADVAIDSLRTTWGPGWDPHEGDPEVIQIEALAPMAADAGAAANRMPAAALRTILEKLFGIGYIAGGPATTTVTFTLADALQHTIYAGTEVIIDGYAFRVINDTPTAALVVPNVLMVCETDGLAGNGLTGANVQMLTSIAWVVSVAASAVSAGGSDAETMASYQDRGSRQLELQAKTLVTARDYEIQALNRPAVGRVTVISDPVARTIRVIASSPTGTALPQTEKDALLAAYAPLRLSNWTVTIEDATTTTVNVTYSVHLYPNYDGPATIAAINAALAVMFNPGAWGRPQQYGDYSNSRWLLQPIVRANKVLELIGSITGVDYVASVAVTGSAGTVTNGDLTMPGSVPLAAAGVFTGSVV